MCSSGEPDRSHLLLPQPHISNYSDEVMPLLLAYLKSVPTGNTQHLAKACYALENFVENLGSDGSVQYWGGEEHIG